jgi:hypothetical protein
MATILSEDEDAASRGKERATLTETVVSLRPGKLVTSQVERLKLSINRLAALHGGAPNAAYMLIADDITAVLTAGGEADAEQYTRDQFAAHTPITTPVPGGGFASATIAVMDEAGDLPEGPVIKRAKMVEPTYDPDEEPFIAS